MKMRLGVTFLGYFTLRVEVSMADISNSICSLTKSLSVLTNTTITILHVYVSVRDTHSYKDSNPRTSGKPLKLILKQNQSSLTKHSFSSYII